MHAVLLGSSGLSVSPLVFGTLPMGPLQADLPPREGGRILLAALELGVTMVDTAELYGTYPHVREALDAFPGDVTVATKTFAADGATARAHVEKALRDLGRERIELVHLHGARVEHPFTERADVFAELLKMKDEGKVGHVGLSSHFVGAVAEAALHPEVEVVHPLVNREGLGILGGTRDGMVAAIEACRRAGKGIYAMKALGGGNFIASARESLAWVRSLDCVHAVAVGMLSAEEAAANVRLFTDGAAPEEAWLSLEARKRRLRIMERFCKGCGACVAACPSGALSLDGGVARVEGKECVLCGYCGASCPEFIIRVV
jgi:aryl-alcohol dehydrogenase-like predicted oxidoreductase/NAD-dependent dihydropyrimidine dehydrogenase PreA subunit